MYSGNFAFDKYILVNSWTAIASLSYAEVIECSPDWKFVSQLSPGKQHFKIVLFHNYEICITIFVSFTVANRGIVIVEVLQIGWLRSDFLLTHSSNLAGETKCQLEIGSTKECRWDILNAFHSFNEPQEGVSFNRKQARISISCFGVQLNSIQFSLQRGLSKRSAYEEIQER